MSDHIHNILTATFVLAGIVLLGLAGADRWQRPEPPAVDYAEAIPIDVDRLLSTDNFQFENPRPELSGKPILALFVLHAEVCPPCLHGVEEYARLLEELDLGSTRIESLALVFEEDPQLARRFLGTSALPLPGAFGNPPQLASTLGRFESGGASGPAADPREVLQQMVFVDTGTGTLFYRALLPNAVTPPQHKEEVLGRVAQAYRELRS